MEFFNLHTHNYTNSKDILELVNQYPNEFDKKIPYYSIGIHPWKIEENRVEAELKIIESKLQTINCLAVGECGLDKRIETSLDLQITIFEKQLLLAEKYKKPVVIHCVAAFQEVIEVKKRLQISVPMIIHGFSKNEQVARQLIENGFYLSFGKYLLQNPELESVFKNIPNNRFFLETDTIEDGIYEVYALAAKYKNLDLTALKLIIENNFQKVFTT
ncbi:TatD family hydrolase [Flavobacterium luteum]|uniref:TatD family deoxyribonuclease n=1 Tax=Flavobacterium luteum TaxID=2026654 RepID=A0A7J5AKY6_9FLAO|nr:TatD family hydrolase [Flavobacterium luteum]KAB1158150.1 TatD family deoxyribonuclease [Flavobacterium luteum]